MFRCYCIAWVWQEKKVHKPLDRYELQLQKHTSGKTNQRTNQEHCEGDCFHGP